MSENTYLKVQDTGNQIELDRPAGMHLKQRKPI